MDAIIREDDAALPRILVMRVKGIVMDQEMEVVMMDTKAVREILFVEAITACNLASSTMKRMIVVKNLQLQIVNQKQHCFQVLYWSLLQAKDAVAVTTRVEDAALQTTLVMKEKEIAMDQVMVVATMDTKDVKGILNVEAITVYNLVLTSMQKMIVVKSLGQVTISHHF